MLNFLENNVLTVNFIQFIFYICLFMYTLYCLSGVVVTDQRRNQGLVLDLDQDQALNLQVEKKIRLIRKILQVTKMHHNRKKKLQMKEMIQEKGLNLDLGLAQDPDLKI